jgi:hypothetical protein
MIMHRRHNIKLSEAFLNMPMRFACFINEAFFWCKSKLPVLGLLSLSATLPGFSNYWMSD